MRKPCTIALSFAVAVAVLAAPLAVPPAQAGPRERKIKKLEAKLKDLQRTMQRAMEFRAKYATLRANSSFLDRLLWQDTYLLRRVLRQLNDPVTLSDAFLSWVSNDFTKAKKYRGRYNPPSTYLWLDCRFGLKAVKDRSYFTVRIDIVDAASGVRIYQSLSPVQRRISRAREFIPVRIYGLKVVGGNYQVRVVVEVGTGRAKKLVPFKYNRTWRPRP
jgi:hypothetical protein